MKTNKVQKKESVYTYENGKVSHITPLEELTRSAMSCLLWEDEFYDDGVSIAERIKELVQVCIDNGQYDGVIKLIKKVKFDMKLRHCPLWLIVSIYKAGQTVSKNLIASVLTRPDDMGELLSLYRKDDEKAPIPNSFKKAFVIALQKFDEYQMAKWDKKAQYKLVDIVNLSHPKVTNAIDKLIKGILPTPMTWEVLLSSVGNDIDKKHNAWLQLLNENKVPDLALLKNIRGILNANIDKNILVERIGNISNDKLLPIDFIRAGQANPTLENEIEAKFLSIFSKPSLKGKTAILVDVSGSMDGENLKYANALAIIGREICEDCLIYSFSNDLVSIPNRRGFALAEAIDKSQSHCSTQMWGSIQELQKKKLNIDRLIVITDEQTSDDPIKLTIPNTYIINISSYRHGVGYEKGIKHINGFSDKVFEYISEIEK